MNTGTQEEVTTNPNEEEKLSLKAWQEHVRSTREEITEPCICSICMEIIVHATISNPCGHIFCASCILCRKLQKKECPYCRAHMTSTTRSRQMDHIISGMALRGEFPFEDLEYYFKRSDTVLPDQKVRYKQIISLI